MGRVVVAGSINMDVVATAERHPRVGETVFGRDVLYFPGGKGANQAVAASKLGATTALIGRLGKDAFGAELRAFLAGQGVDLELGARDRRRTHRHRDHHTRRRRQHHRCRSRRQWAGDPGGRRSGQLCKGRHRRQPVRNSRARDFGILYAGASGRRDDNSQPGAGARIRQGPARSRRYARAQRDRAWLAGEGGASRGRRSRALRRGGTSAASPSRANHLRHAWQTRRGGIGRRRNDHRARPRA